MQKIILEAYNVLTETVNKTALSSNDDTRIPLIDCKEVYPHDPSENIIRKTWRN